MIGLCTGPRVMRFVCSHFWLLVSLNCVLSLGPRHDGLPGFLSFVENVCAQDVFRPKLVST